MLYARQGGAVDSTLRTRSNEAFANLEEIQQEMPMTVGCMRSLWLAGWSGAFQSLYRSTLGVWLNL